MSHEQTATPAAANKPSYVVGIGASAGGLQALEQFFDNMSPVSGMAFVVIQHLSPDFKSLMDDLLSRHTAMPIHRVTNGIDLASDCIYLIPARTQMTVAGGKLYLTEKVAGQLELPIDTFFDSLAADQGERAIGIILSGTGSDGSRGVQSIHKKGGLVLAHTPESAQFDGMPRAAIATGICDFTLTPDRMPRILIEYGANPLTVRNKVGHELEVFEDEGEYAEVFALMRQGYRLDFSKYKGSTVGRRIRRRMEFRQIPEVSDYATILAGDLNELEALYKDLLIGVTEFFRDPQAFGFLEREVIPQLFARLQGGEDLRVWSAACATGEEAYSLAILLAEHAEEIGFVGKVTVFATDVHKASLEVASQGLYDRERLTNVSPQRLERSFKKEGNDTFRVAPELRKMVVFAPHNLLKDPPFTRLDLICCRNLLIYFQPTVQEKVISLFHFALKKDGVLFQGSSEGLGAFADEFEVIAGQHRIFRKIRDLKLAIDMESVRSDRERSVPVTVFQPAQSRMVNLDRQMLFDYDLLLKKHVPPGVLVNENRQIIHYFGNVAEYLKMPEGRIENDILQLAEDNLHIALSTALLRVNKLKQSVTTRNVRVARGGEQFLIDLFVDPLADEKSRTTHYHIYFERVRPAETGFPLAEHPEEAPDDDFDSRSQFRQHLNNLEIELQSTRENLQTTVEELQTSNEELQATNEELLASNEELQSTNEELHSVNEELYSVNSEFERKNIELKQLNTDHDNLLASIDIGTIFLDRQMRIRKFNHSIAAFFKLLPQDIGRPIDHIAYHLAHQEELLADIHRVLNEGVPMETEERTRNGKWLLNRIVPFRTETGQVEGVVITFTDISRIKEAELGVIRMNEELELKVAERTCDLTREAGVRQAAEEAMRLQERFTRSSIDALTAHICVIDRQGRIIISNRSWTEHANDHCSAKHGERQHNCGRSLICEKRRFDDPDGLSRQLRTFQPDGSEKHADAARFVAGIEATLTGEAPEFVMEYVCRARDRENWYIVRVNRFVSEGESYAVIAHENISEAKQMERDLAEQQSLLQRLNQSLEVRIEDTVAELRCKDQVMITQSRQAAMGEMIGNIAHQWRQPLNAFALLLANIRDLHRFEELNTESLDAAIADGNRLIQKMSSTINDFRNFFRPDKEQVAFSARQQIEIAVSLVESDFRDSNIDIHREPAEDALLLGFPNEFSQVLLNLFANAKEAITASGRDRGRVEIRLARSGGNGTVAVRDDGGGIPAEIIDKIFDPYFSTKQMGSGIGLYMSKMIIERNMQGRIAVHNVDGGAEFLVTTPLAGIS